MLAPGTTLTDMTFILAFQEDQPRFANWSVDFTFGESSRVSEAAGVGSPRGTSPQPPAEERLVAEAGDRRQPSGISGEQTRAGPATGAACWKELASHPGCHVWHVNFYADQTVTWTGGCSGGQASGTGTLKWIRASTVDEHSGLLRNGEYEGRWVTRDSFLGTVEEGPYVDGKRNGHWVRRFTNNGTVEDGPYVDGRMHGHWVETRASGDIIEGPYVDDREHGDRVFRFADGSVHEGPYTNGKMHGRWVKRHPSGRTSASTYVNGSPQ